MPIHDPATRMSVASAAPAARRTRLSVKRRRGRGGGDGALRPSPAVAIVTRPSSGARAPPLAPHISEPETYGVAIAPPLPGGFDVVAVTRRLTRTSPSRRPPCWCHGRGTFVALHVARRGQRPLVGLSVARRRHRGEHPIQVGHHLGADDLPAARL